MKNIVEHMKLYASHHQKIITKITHFIGVPLIIFAILMLFSWVPIPLHIMHHDLTLAWVLVALVLLYYLWLDVYLTLIAAIIFLPVTYYAEVVARDKFNLWSFGLFCLLFIVGWSIQLIGHYFEGKRPAFLTNLFQVFVAPLFLIAELCFLFGFRKDLAKKIRE